MIVKGFNDVIGLDNRGVPALGIMSSRMTEQQGEKIARLAKQLGINGVNLVFDFDEAGTDGAREALWFFAERQLDVRLAGSPTMRNDEFKGSQPESITQSQIEELLTR